MGPTSSGLPARTLTGKIKIHPVGYGFVVPDDKSEDVHVSARNRGTAMDGDTVEIEAWPGVRGVEGRVTRVISRGRAKITGQLVRRGKHQVLQPDDPRITGLVSLSGSIPEARDGIAVVAEITRYPDVPDGPIEAKVLKVLGDPDDPRTEVEKVLACADVEEEFPDEVERIAAGFGDTMHALRSRRPGGSARGPLHDHRSRDGARLRRRGGAGEAAERRVAPVGRGGRRLALRAGGVADRRRGAPARLQHLPAEPGDPHAARAALGADVLAGPRGGPAGDGGADRSRSAGQRRRPRLHGGGDPLEGAPRLPGRGGGAGGRHPRQAEEVRAVPAGACGRWTRWRGSCAWRGSPAGRSTSISRSRSWSSIATIRAWCAPSASRAAIRASGRPTR